MRLLEQTELKLEWGDVDKRQRRISPIAPRSPGVHLSGVLRHIAISSGILNVARTSEDLEIMPLRMMLGMFFEEGMVSLYPDMQSQPGELERDEIFGTPDGLSVVDGRYLLEEFKLTWKSEHNYGGSGFPSLNWMWMRQGLGYLALLQANGLDVAPQVRYHVGWVCGDYRPPSPKYCRYLVEFDQSEIDGLWALVLRHKSDAGVVAE